MARQGLTVTVRIDGAQETLRALRALPAEANEQMRVAATRLAETLARRVHASARAAGRQAALIAPTVKARRDRVPVVVAGGAKRVGRKRKPAYKVLFGSEFGATHLGQFKPRQPRGGSYWFFKTIDSERANIASEWRRCADAIVASFTTGGE